MPSPPFVAIDRFFDGNDDLGSIGCNLMEHPGIPVFREALTRLATRPDVTGVYAQISEIDPGDGCWAFSDTILVTGSVEIAAVEREVEALQPDEVGPSDRTDLPGGARALYIWWD